jgi:hypothetical protein
VLSIARHLLGLVAGDGSDDAVLLALYAIGGALDVALGLRSLVFGFTGSVLLLNSRVNIVRLANECMDKPSRSLSTT